MGTGAWCCLQHVSVGQTWFRMSRLWSVVRPRSLPARDQENGRGAWRAAVPGTQNAFHVVSLLKPHSYGSGAGIARRGGAYFFYPPAVLRCMGAEPTDPSQSRYSRSMLPPVLIVVLAVPALHPSHKGGRGGAVAARCPVLAPQLSSVTALRELTSVTNLNRCRPGHVAPHSPEKRQ